MRIHRMEFRGIGPFSGRHVIDFDALGAGGIFLLEGPTGAGKSTIIDSVTFALYGQVAARAASQDRIRSSYATPDQESYVDLVFETGRGIYRVRRSPEYQRPKKRGEGLTTEQSSVKLWRWTSLPDDLDSLDLGGVGEIISIRTGEADAEIQAAIGLNRDQFTQTVVLPQGEFAQFLKAGPDARADILQRIFGTQFYDDLQEQLAASSREAKRAIEAAKGALQQGVARLAGATRVDDDTAATLTEAVDPGRDVEVDLEHVRALLGDLVETLRVAATEAETEHKVATEAIIAAQTAWDTAKRQHDLLSRRAGLHERLAELNESADAVAAGRAEAERARKAALVQVSIEQHARDTRALAESAAAVEAAAGALSDLGISVPSEADAAAQATALKELQVTHSARAQQLAGSLQRSHDLIEAATEIADLSARHDAQAEAVAELKAALATRPEARNDLVERQQAAQKLANQVPRHETELNEAQTRLDAVTRVATLEQDVARLEARAKEALAAADAVRRAADHAHQQRIAGIAGELAQELGTDEPCPVCGSTDHPAPAQHSDDHVSAEHVEAANAALRDATELLVERQGDHARKNAELVTAQAAAGGLDSETAADAVAQTTEALIAARQGERDVTTLTAELAAFDQATQELTTQLNAAQQQLVRLSHDLDQQVTAWYTAADGVLTTAGHAPLPVPDGEQPADGASAGSDAGPAPSAITPAAITAVEAAREALTESVEIATVRVQALTDYERAHRDHVSMRSREQESQTTVTERLTGHGFTDTAEVHAAALPEADITAREQASVRHATELEQTTAALAADELAGLDPELAAADIDLEAPAVILEAATAARTVTHSIVTARQADLTQATTEVATVENLLTDLARAQADAGPRLRMAELASGNQPTNPLGMSLSTYVLVTRFEDVVAAANARLRTLSGGQFELVRSTEKEQARKRRVGLSLAVLDHYTGDQRNPGSLSGGQTFYVSLCLALGLTDVVQAEAGGVELNTLFVDEGFGTLDPDVLETVMTTLTKLHDSGRVVGIVSHVDSLKQSIAERVEVRKISGGGSTLHVMA